MRVYRLETPEGEGVYAAGLGFSCTRAAMVETVPEDYSQADWHPCPAFDPPLAAFWRKEHLSYRKQMIWEDGGRREWFCGFADEEQMLNWFPPQGLAKMIQMANRLHRTIRVSIYEIHGTKVKKGDMQVIFRRNDAKLVATIPLEKFSA